jgi:predicted PurR-regulated permease PerM
MLPVKEMPFYIQFTSKLLMIFLLCVFIIYGSNVIIPLVFSILLSILLLPLANFLQHKARFSPVMANLTVVLLALFFIIGIIYFFSHQIAGFLQDIPSIRQHLESHYETLQHWIQQKFNISSGQQTVLIKSATQDVKDQGTQVIGETFFTITHTVFYVILIAIYSFLILFYRHLIRKFIFDLFKKAGDTEISAVLNESKGIVQKYMMGLIIEMGIVAILNTGILLVIGIKYAIFLGIFSAILNIIPYVGILSGIVFTALVTLTTSSHLSDIVWIIVGFEVIHFIDANFLMPRIVGSKVKINALVTILGVVIGGSLVGLPGIFLALPVIAILKIIFDRIDELKPWGMLMGDDTTSPNNIGLMKKVKSIRLRNKMKPVTKQQPDNP